MHNNISSVNNKEAEYHAEQNERKCEVYGSRVCLFVCLFVLVFLVSLFCFVLFLFPLTFANIFSWEIFTARPTKLFDKINCKHTTYSKQTHKNVVMLTEAKQKKNPS